VDSGLQPAGMTNQDSFQIKTAIIIFIKFTMNNQDQIEK